MTRTKREDLRSTAQMLMTEQMNMNAELETLATKKGWKVQQPSSPPASTDSRAESESTAADANLDDAFIDAQIEAHEQNIEMFRRQSTAARDADLREFATKALPRLEQHLAALKKLET
jgi:putative membrane protein